MDFPELIHNFRPGAKMGADILAVLEGIAGGGVAIAGDDFETFALFHGAVILG